MKVRQTGERMNDATLRRLSRFDAADLGPHATTLYRELGNVAGAGLPLATNTDKGEIIHSAVEAYLDANPLDPYGFNGWVGPEPHGAPLANSGAIRDGLIADRVVTWLENRYRLRREGDPQDFV